MKRDESRSETDFGRPGSLWGSGAKGKTRTSWGFSGPMGLISLIRIEMLAVLSVGWQLVSDGRNSGEVDDSSGDKRLPLSQSDCAASFVGLAIDKVALGSEVIVKRSMD